MPWSLFGNIEDLNDGVVPLDEALGRHGTNLLERLSEAPSWTARFELIDTAFGSAKTAPLSPEVERLRRQLVASKGRARVEPLMDETGWSRRYVTERFRRQLGTPPKAYARLLRFGHATSLLSGATAGRPLAAVAAEAGYYDQSHLTRDFVRLAGMTPGAYAANAVEVPEVRFVQDRPIGSPSEWIP